MMARTAALAALTAAVVLGSGRLESQSRGSAGWIDYGGGPDSSKYVDLTQITPANVSRLRPVWTYPIGDNNVYQFNPIVAGTTMYVLAKNSSLVALDAVTGKELWIHAGLRGITRRGINYWESADRRDRRLIFQINNYLQAIDATTGQSILTFGTNGLVDLREGVGRDAQLVGRVQSNTPGRIYQNLLLLGSAPGEGYLSGPGTLRAFDVVTGKLAWAFHTIPHPGEDGHETWPKDAWRYVGGANTWGEISVDAERGIAYFPTGSPTYDYYGADRVGSNLYANSLIALDARTGKRLWHFQMVHHDLWDYDPTAAPQLVTVRHEGRTIDAVAQAAKHGFLFVFDRVTGRPLWPVEERAIPKSDMPGEQTWPTQPFPTKPAPFDLQGRNESHLIDYTPELRQQALAMAKENDLFSPFFNPPVHRGNPEGKTRFGYCPGDVGGVNITGPPAADPTSGVIFITSTSGCGNRLLVPGKEGDATLKQPTGKTIVDWTVVGGRGGRAPSSLDGLSIWKGPYGRIVAIDLNSGEHLWTIPNGEAPDTVRNHPLLKGLKVADPGRSGHSAMLATATMLMATGLTSDNQAHLFAIDKKTGKRLGKVPTPQVGEYGIMTYMHGGKQYVVLPVNGGYVALALP